MEDPVVVDTSSNEPAAVEPVEPEEPVAAEQQEPPVAAAADDDRPRFDHGEVICSESGEFAFRIEDLIGEGRCCLVYAARCIRDDSKVALKFFKRGRTYEGALQRELYILNLLKDEPNIVSCYGYFRIQSLHCQVMEFLEVNVRQLIFRNERQGLCPWAVQKFAADMLSSLAALHSRNFVHADLKPANVMWSSNDGCFKLLDFGLTFHTEEHDLHQIQSKGYQAPEAAEWNSYKEEMKKVRKRKLQGTFCDIRRACATAAAADASSEASDRVSFQGSKDRWPSESSGIFTASEDQSQCGSPPSRDDSSAAARGVHNVMVPPPNAPPPPPSVRHSAVILGDHADWRSGASGGGGGGCGARGGRRQSRSPLRKGVIPLLHERQASMPPMPGCAIDLWAFGCLLFEVLTGTKLFRAGDVLASVLRPPQLLDMKLGECEVRYDVQGEGEVFAEVRDLIFKCLLDEPGQRCSAADALDHAFVRRSLAPTLKDMVLLSTNILMLMDILKEAVADEKEVEDILVDIRGEARKFGTLVEVKAHGDHVYIEFQEASTCHRACKELSGRTFDGKVVLAVFYPTGLWTQNSFMS